LFETNPPHSFPADFNGNDDDRKRKEAKEKEE
jgi:hypothetical protein